MASAQGLSLSDRWIIGHLHNTVDRVTALIDKNDYGEAGRTLYDFAWSDFADWYIESSKVSTAGTPGAVPVGTSCRALPTPLFAPATAVIPSTS